MALDIKLDNTKLKTILLNGNYISVEDWDKAEASSKDHHTPAINYLIDESLITINLLGQAIAESMSVPYIDLKNYQPSREYISQIPAEFGQEKRVILFAVSGDSVTVATDNLEPHLLEVGLKDIFPNKKIIIGYALPENVDPALIVYRKSLETRFGKILEKKEKIAPEIIEQIIEDAVALRASDIHLEPQEKEVIIRFRIDGMLSEAGRLPKSYYENIINRIKVQARLRIDEHFAAQDGAIRFSKNDTNVDLRISIVPTLDGEKVVIRVLSEYIRSFTMSDLGLTSDVQKALATASRKPFGMILVVGPTGSGKTTTLYAILKTLNSTEVNVTSIEDPVEYKVVGINQIQVNMQTNLTFAQGLRSIVRQDPNIILVGEIRDLETADIAVNAALTGHLLLSTFHANDTSSAIPRLFEMGLEPFLVASTLDLILAQRLARKICENCRYSFETGIGEIEKILPSAKNYFQGDKITLFKGKGCSTCHDTGYHGRTAIFEYILMTPEIQNLMLSRPSALQIWELAKSQGAISMFEDGIDKVKNGIATIEEVLRVIGPPAVNKP